jgi:glycosyltransferase involved in cell wall biosynthesis
MRVAIVHYHLRRGGVTRVIEHALATPDLDRDDVECAVLSGEPAAESSFDGRDVVVVDGLGYAEQVGTVSARILFEQLVASARNAFSGQLPDIWHVHNHSLGKNPALTECCCRLAADGHRLLLQIHDFAEDGRPEDYRVLRDGLGSHGDAASGLGIYPQASHVHYAVLNGRDREFLARAGVAAERIHWLPNPVSVATDRQENEAAISDLVTAGSKLYLYPTRAIRRKNVGEFLLWAAVARPDETFGATLAPENPQARGIYDRWVVFARDAGLPVEFELGSRPDVSFSALLDASHAIVTTSVAEGFGLAYLEPWLSGKRVVGRDLPEVTRDFATTGVELPGLYQRLDVPLEWIGNDQLVQHLKPALETALESYGRSVSSAEVEKARASAVVGEYVDFGRLDEDLQRTVIERVVADSCARGALQPACLDDGQQDEAVVDRNLQVIEQHYSVERYGKTLSALYGKIAEQEIGEVETLDANALLECFLDPARFCLIRT